MSHQSCEGFCEDLRYDLESQGYNDITPPELQLALFKQTMHGLVPVIVAADCTVYSTDPPQEDVTFNWFEKWAKRWLGNNGRGMLIFVCDKPPIEQVERILKLGRRVFGLAVPYVYDLSSHKYWWWQEMMGPRSGEELKFA